MNWAEVFSIVISLFSLLNFRPPLSPIICNLLQVAVFMNDAIGYVLGIDRSFKFDGKVGDQARSRRFDEERFRI